MKRILALCLLLLVPALALAGEPKKGDNVLGATYAISALDGNFDARASTIGLVYERMIVDDFSFEIGAAVPLERKDVDAMTAHAGVNYAFGPLFIPMRGIYAGPVDGWAVASGVGINFYAGSMNLRFAGLVNYLLDDAFEDRTSYTAEAAARFRF